MTSSNNGNHANHDNNISRDDILAVANLARLGIDTDTASHYANDISKILAMMQTLAAVDTDQLVPLANIYETCQTLRPDVADSNIDRDLNQSIAPAVAEGLYLVPQVIE